DDGGGDDDDDDALDDDAAASGARGARCRLRIGDFGLSQFARRVAVDPFSGAPTVDSRGAPALLHAAAVRRLGVYLGLRHGEGWRRALLRRGGRVLLRLPAGDPEWGARCLARWAAEDAAAAEARATVAGAKERVEEEEVADDHRSPRGNGAPLAMERRRQLALQAELGDPHPWARAAMEMSRSWRKLGRLGLGMVMRGGTVDVADTPA
ncbi:MAG: hypothetical protein VX017_10430, partial [Pseudomonadota bacterium]|nr:hypothetical protein [Pseudomonadota bacterium]